MKFLIPFLLSLLGGEALSPLSTWAQNQCSHWISPGPFVIWDQALICGISPGIGPMSPLNQLGLSHLIVVSGAHLIFLESLIRTLSKAIGWRPRSFVVYFILCTYSLFAGLQPPVVRALFQFPYFPSKGWNVFLSGIFAWIFFRELSLSLALSWACALAVSLPSVKPLNPWIKSLLIYLCLFPMLLGLGTSTVYSAFINPLAIIYFGVFLFPVSVLNLILPLEVLSNGLWNLFLSATSHLAQNLNSLSPEPINLSLFLYLLVINFIFIKMEIGSLRQRLWK